jgi:hypothetical protein
VLSEASKEKKMKTGKHVAVAAVLTTLIGVVSDSGREAHAQFVGTSNSVNGGPCNGCSGTVGVVDPGGPTIPPGYQMAKGTFALQLNRGFGSTPPGIDPASVNYNPQLASTFRTHYVTAPDGGGSPKYANVAATDPQVSFRVNTQTIGAWERFNLLRLGCLPNAPNTCSYSLFTANGNFVTFMNLGGGSGLNNGSAPLHTDAWTVGQDEKFEIEGLFNSSTGNWIRTTLKTRTGNYVTAVGGGGIGAPSSGSGNSILHTDKKWNGPGSIGGWEIVTLLPQ